MAITPTEAYKDELKKNENRPNVILEVTLGDSGGVTTTVKWGYHDGGFSDVLPDLKSVSSLQNKIDTSRGYTTRGVITAVITGRDNFKDLIGDEFLKNRRVSRKDGFVASGFAYSDYVETFTGKILDWSRSGDEMSLTIGDDMAVDASKKLPVEQNNPGIQHIDYTNTNPVDIMTTMLKTNLGISASYVNTTQFESERDDWYNGWKFDRVITEPTEANKLLNELQRETNSFILHDGEKISFKAFTPPSVGATVEEWTDDAFILKDTLSQKSGYKDNFFNRVVVYYNYDESGGNDTDRFESIYWAWDASSRGTAQWDETKTKVIKSKWIRTLTHSQQGFIAGVKIYHVSTANGAGAGIISYHKDDVTLTYTAPGGTAGEAVNVTNNGKYQVFDADKTKYVRVLVDTSTLPGSTGNGPIALWWLNSDADDDSGSPNTHHGSATNVSWDTGNQKLGSACASFNGSSSKIDVTDHSDFDGYAKDGLAFPVWLKVDAGAPSSGDAQIAGKWKDIAGSMRDGWYIWLDYATGLIDFKITNIYLGRPTITSSTDINDGAFHHVVANLNNLTGVMELWIDGVKEATTILSYPPFKNGETLEIGHDGAGRYFHGLMDEMIVWKRGITPAEVAELYSAGSPAEFDPTAQAITIDTVTLTTLSGDTYAQVLANRLLNRFRNPVATIEFEIDINNLVYDGNFRKLADLVDLTSDEVCDKGRNTWTNERIMITSLRPDFGTGKCKVGAVQARALGGGSGHKYGQIAPNTVTDDWDDASDEDRQWAFISDTSGVLGTEDDPGFYIY